MATTAAPASGAHRVEHGSSRRRYIRILLAAFALCLLSMIGSNLVNSDFGKVQVENFMIEDANGHAIACQMYKPRTATAQHPAPVVVALHGSFDSKETQDYTGLELSRRGIVVITMDADGHGDSANYKENPMDAFFTVTASPGSKFNKTATSPGSGMNDVVDYVYNNLSFIDKKQIGITGHSLGGKMANAALAHNLVDRQLGGVNKIASIFLMGNQQLGTKAGWSDHLTYDPDDKANSGDEVPLYYDVDYGVDAGQLDENNYQTEAGGPATFYKSQNARTFINELDNYKLQKGQDVEVGKIYKGPVKGSKDEHIRVLYQPYETHILNHFSLATTGNEVDFFQHSFKAPHELDRNNLIIQYKWIFNTLGVIGFYAFLITLALYLLTCGPFRRLLAPRDAVFVPEAPRGALGHSAYWLLLLAGSAIPALFMIPLEQWVGARLGPDFATRSLFGTKIWPQGLSLEQGLWTAAAGLVGLALFALGYLVIGRRHGLRMSDWNLAISGRDLLRTLEVCVLAIAGAYSLVVLAKYFFNTDFRLASYVIKVPSSGDLLIALRFIPLFAIFFLANALCQNLSNMVAGRKEWLNIALMCLANIAGLIGIWVYQYSNLIAHGTVKLDSARVMLSWPLFINLCLCTVISRLFYRRTGKVYLGAILNSLLFTIITCANTMTLVPTHWWF